MKAKHNKEIQSDIAQLTQRKLLLTELFPEKIIKKKNIFQVMMYIYQNLEVKYEGISNNFNLDIKKTKNSELLNVIFNLNKSKITDNVNKGFLNCLILKGDLEELHATLLNIPKVQKVLDEFIIRNSKSNIENFSTNMISTINDDIVLKSTENTKKNDIFLY